MYVRKISAQMGKFCAFLSPSPHTLLPPPLGLNAGSRERELSRSALSALLVPWLAQPISSLGSNQPPAFSAVTPLWPSLLEKNHGPVERRSQQTPDLCLRLAPNSTWRTRLWIFLRRFLLFPGELFRLDSSFPGSSSLPTPPLLSDDNKLHTETSGLTNVFLTLCLLFP